MQKPNPNISDNIIIKLMYMFDKKADCKTGYIRTAIMNTKKINIITLNRY